MIKIFIYMFINTHIIYTFIYYTCIYSYYNIYRYVCFCHSYIFYDGCFMFLVFSRCPLMLLFVQVRRLSVWGHSQAFVGSSTTSFAGGLGMGPILEGIKVDGENMGKKYEKIWKIEDCLSLVFYRDPWWTTSLQIYDGWKTASKKHEKFARDLGKLNSTIFSRNLGVSFWLVVGRNWLNLDVWYCSPWDPQKYPHYKNRFFLRGFCRFELPSSALHHGISSTVQSPILICAPLTLLFCHVLQTILTRQCV